MKKTVNGVLICASLALALGYAAAFVARWGARGLIGAVIFSAVLALAAAAATGALPQRKLRFAAAFGYAAMTAWAVFSLMDAFKNDWIRDLLILQAAAGVAGLVACAMRREEW